MFRGLRVKCKIIEPIPAGYDAKRLEETYEQTKKALTKLPALPTKVTMLLVNSVDNCRFFETERGEPGLGPPGTQHGDVVAVLAGGALPFVLRKSHQGVRGIDQLYKLVGECYVEGLQNGQHLNESVEGGHQTIWLK